MVCFTSLCVVSAYLPHVDFNTDGIAESDVLFQQTLDDVSRSLATYFASNPTRPRRVILLVDANIEVPPDVLVEGVEMTGKGTVMQEDKDTGGHARRRNAKREVMWESFMSFCTRSGRDS